MQTISHYLILEKLGEGSMGIVFRADHTRLRRYIALKLLSDAYSGARNVGPHLFRHSIARHLKTAGYAAEFIQEFLGHQSIKTTMDTYGTLSLGEMQQMIVAKTGDTSLLGDAKSARGELPPR